ncbi:HET domain-containing protein [Trichoderma novae-zelandiae]
MDEKIDNRWNRKSGFRHPAIQRATETRLLKIAQDPASQSWHYDLVAISLDDLSSTPYRALSYTWGEATSTEDVRTIRVSNQEFIVRQNLFDFLSSAAAREEQGLFFIDAICINQLDLEERQAQVQAMALIYRRATTIISWLGTLPQEHYHGCQVLRHASDVSCRYWSGQEWKALRHLSYAPYWSRVWVVQEVLLASNLQIWCGPFTFSPTLLGRIPQSREAVETKFDADGRPSVLRSDASRVRSPSEAILGHRMRLIPRMTKDTTREGCVMGTLADMTAVLRQPSETFERYQSRVPDPLRDIIRKYGRLQCTDIRDRLYGFLGLLKDSSRKKIKPDYTRGVEHTFYQALRCGLAELCPDEGTAPWGLNEAWMNFYCEARDAFHMGDEVSIQIFRRVYRELNFKERMQDALFQQQWDLNYGWRGPDAVRFGAFARMIVGDELEEEASSDAKGPPLLKFHNKQRRLYEKLSMKLRRRPKSSYSILLS